MGKLLTSLLSLTLAVTALLTLFGESISTNFDKISILANAETSTDSDDSIFPQKTLFIGNSLLVGHGDFGMCATDKNHDYFHYVTDVISSHNSDAEFVKQGGNKFEDQTTVEGAKAWLDDVLSKKLSSDIDLVIIQLGDNISTNQKVEVFKESSKLLIEFVKDKCPSARIAWVGEWYSSKVKQQIIANVCADTGSEFIDISDLYTVENLGSIGDVIHRTTSSATQYTIDSYVDNVENKELTITFTVGNREYTSVVSYERYKDNGDGTITITGYDKIVTSGGVASHPGNLGMLRIANRICYKLGFTKSEDEIVDSESALQGKIYYQLNVKDNSQVRFVAEVNISDIEKANSGNVSIKIGNSELSSEILTAYRSIISNGKTVKAGDGKCFIIAPVINGIAEGMNITSTFKLDIYKYGLTRTVLF